MDSQYLASYYGTVDYGTLGVYLGSIPPSQVSLSLLSLLALLQSSRGGAESCLLIMTWTSVPLLSVVGVGLDVTNSPLLSRTTTLILPCTNWLRLSVGVVSGEAWVHLLSLSFMVRASMGRVLGRRGAETYPESADPSPLRLSL